MTIPRQSRRAACDLSSPSLREIAGALARRWDHLAEQIIQDAGLPAGASLSRAVAPAAQLWLDVLAGKVPTAEVSGRFSELGQEHVGHSALVEDVIAMHHTCVAVLRAAVAEQARRARPKQDTSKALHVFDTVANRSLPAAVAAITAAYRAAGAGAGVAVGAGSDSGTHEPVSAARAVRVLSGQDAGDVSASRLAGRIRTPLQWCLVSRRASAMQAEDAYRRFTAANPGALAAVVGTALIAYSYDQPVLLEDFPPSGLAAVQGCPAQAARHAGICADLARGYGHPLVDLRRFGALIAVVEASHETQEQLLTACLGPLYGDEQYAHLLETLRVYLAHELRAAATARSLYIHRHTLAYRLRSIRTLTGLDLDQPLQRLQAELALLLLSHRPADV
ncbi:PucR family transcriptional regulator [Streptomyces sp. NPDC102365]|uniref:PucR family transcriptional regulator n=1 Tax=Streptomyces sp. NPDC102365 TaxID=3366162 RepID=UPI003804B233